MAGPVRARFADGRWHFQHGPIDLVIGVEAEAGVAAAAIEQGWARFQDMLATLVGELPLLRTPLDQLVARGVAFEGPVARRMLAACLPYRDVFITPMAAVAGSVADEMLAAMVATSPDAIQRAYVNNGGDIALHLAPGERFRVGLVDLLPDPEIARGHAPRGPLRGAVDVDASMPVRGIATSGWRGRSLSLGIADSATVLAANAAAADAAATMVANAVDVKHPAVRRMPASQRVDDSDLGDRLVTVGVDELPGQALDRAMESGVVRAQALRAAGLVHAAAIVLQGRCRIVGALGGAPVPAAGRGAPATGPLTLPGALTL